MDRDWIIAPPWTARDQGAARWRVPPLVAEVLHHRGLTLDRPAAEFLDPQLNNLFRPETLPGATAAAKHLAEAVRTRRKIVLYGDYDVDGMTGVAILWHVLHLAGASPSFYVPHRLEEGYGLNVDAVRTLVAEGAQLIVTVDCGITGVEAARVAEQAGVPLIVTDHHQRGVELPVAAVLVHPSLQPGYPNPNLSGAGVAFKLAWALAMELCECERVTEPYRRFLRDALALAALGTIADVVPLLNENRIIARHGLALLPSTPFVGVQALIATAGLTGENLTGEDVGFKLAPRLNAAGRMGHARLGVELLTRADAARAREIALYLEDQNRKRQSTERRISKQALEIVERQRLDADACRAIVLAGDDWHAGVIGIVAARLVDRFHRPTVMIATEDGLGQGSARSVPHFDLTASLSRCSDHLLTFGGHAMAAGLRIQTPRIPAFTEAFTAHANSTLTAADLRPKLRLDAETTLGVLDLATVEMLRELGPFGEGNPPPRFATGWVHLADEPRCVGKDATHLQAVFRDNGAVLKAIAFGQAPKIELLKEHRRCRLAFQPLINQYQGRRTVEMQVLGFEFPQS